QVTGSNSFPKTQHPTLFSRKPSSFLSQSEFNLTWDRDYDRIVLNIRKPRFPLRIPHRLNLYISSGTVYTV
ncbi:hypothetical protein LEMLEM_LOCUS18842, partial [Lemmus lemmus]